MRELTMARMLLGLVLCIGGLLLMGLGNLGGTEILLGVVVIMVGMATLDEGGPR